MNKCSICECVFLARKGVRMRAMTVYGNFFPSGARRVCKKGIFLMRSRIIMRCVCAYIKKNAYEIASRTVTRAMGRCHRGYLHAVCKQCGRALRFMLLYYCKYTSYRIRSGNCKQHTHLGSSYTSPNRQARVTDSLTTSREPFAYVCTRIT